MRLLLSPAAPGSWNMALDEALAESVGAGGEPVLRFYRWEPYCLSLGRNQPAAGLYDRAEIERLGLGVVRRPTGGRAVLHARELTYAVALPERSLGGPREAYAAINRALVSGLQLLGVPATLQGTTRRRAPVPSTDPCFQQPAEGEVMVGDRKLVGSAQVRRNGVLLQHGSLLLHDDQPLLAAILQAPVHNAAASEAPAVLADHLHPLPGWEALCTALVRGWETVLGVVPRASEPTGSELERAAALRKRHEDLEWIWRR